MTYFQAEANKLQEAIDRVRELVKEALLQQEQNGGRVAIFPNTILEALDGEPDV